MAAILSTLKPNTKLAWQITLPLVLILILAGGWTAYWFVASTKAEEILDQVLAQQKAKGLTITCADRSISGFPFKFLLSCTKLKIIRETPTRQTSLSASRLVFVVQAYNFNHMIGEIYGPFELTRGRKRDATGTVVETRKLFYGNAKTITSSLILKNRALKETTLVVRGLSGTLLDYSLNNVPQKITTDLKESVIHIRTTDDTSKPIGAYDAAGVVKGLSLVGGVANIRSEKGAQLEDFDVRMKITNAPYRITGKLLDLLKIWKANDGKATITELNATSGGVKLKGSGQFKLDDLGRAQGVLKTKMTGLDGLINELVANGRLRQKDANMGLAAINILGNAGNGAVKVALRAQKGNVYFGPFKIAILKPLFKK